jgi:SAM-dependent methyltransferase
VPATCQEAGYGILTLMTHHNQDLYDNPYVADLYDNLEQERDDIDLIFRLIPASSRQNILEPFCGTGRILLPLAQAGHTLTGFDQAAAMIEQARAKLSLLDEEVQQRVTLYQSDAILAVWPQGFDVVVLGGNCLYELAAPAEQEQLIASAAAALKPGGFVYVDNDHMEGELDASWQDVGVVRSSFPAGITADGSRVESTIETIWFDAPRRLVCFHRNTTAVSPDGRLQKWEYIQQKHPVSTGEVRSWLEAHGFLIEQQYGDRRAVPYSDDAPRSIFWARKA